MVTSEARPFAKTGGLADVCGALPLALARLGHRVTIVLPNYRGTRDRQRGGHAGRRALRPAQLSGAVPRAAGGGRGDGRPRRRTGALRPRRALWRREAGSTATTRSASPSSAAARSNTRGSAGPGPSVIHAHDWQGGLAPVYARTVLRDDPDHRRRADRADDPQPRVPGAVRSRRELTWIGLGRDLFTPRPAGVLGTRQPAQGGRGLQRQDHDREPDLRERDPDAGGRVRLQRHPGEPRAGSRRHPQRHRHRRLESRRPTRYLPAHFDARTSSGRRRRSGRCSSPPACRRRPRGAAGDRHRDAGSRTRRAATWSRPRRTG